VTKSLIVDKTDKDVNLHLISENSGVHCLVTVIIIPVFEKFRAEMLDNVIVFILFEGLSSLKFSLKGTSLACKTLYKHTHCHS
jgi:hypothetical protein